MTFPEFRVVFRRDGGKKQYRVFQRRGIANQFMERLRKDARADLAPLAELYFDTRECGAWTPVTIHGTEEPR